MSEAEQTNASESGADGGPGAKTEAGEAFFYHMTRSPLEATLPVLLERSLANDWRVVVRARNDQRLIWLDELLWTTPSDNFLPHGRAGGPHDADQPVLLTCDTDMGNDAPTLISVDGAEVTAQEVQRLSRVSILFDGNDPDAVQHARDQWKALVAAGCGAKYWSQESGRWEMKASA